MRTFVVFSLLFLLFSSCKQESSPSEVISQAGPRAKKVDFEFKNFDDIRKDPYNWISNKEDSAVIQLLEQENAFVEEKLSHTKAIQDEIYKELTSRIDQKFESLPVKRNGYWYYVRYDEGNEYPYYCRKKETLDAPEEIILNVNEMSKGYAIFRLYEYFISPDNQTVAYLVDTSGDRRNTLFFKNLATGQLLSDQVSDCSDGGAWANDSKTFFYCLNDKTVRGYRIMRHQLGAAVQNDPEIYIDRDSTFSVFVNRSSDDRFIFVGSYSTTSSEFWFLDADKPTNSIKVVQPRQKGLEYQAESYYGSDFYIYNNHNATNFKVSTAPIRNPVLANWKDVVPHQEDVLVNGFEVLQDYILVQERTQALDKVKIIDRKSGTSSYIDFGEEAYTASMYLSTDEFNTDSIRYNYSSLTTPNSIYGYNLKTSEKKLLKQNKVGGGFDSQLYETRRLWATAQDGTQIPISIVYRKDKFKQDGNNPCLQYAYGSYGSSSMPGFRSNIFSLLDRGFVYAIAHIRGGQEMGRKWYEDGKLLKKKNTFTDFIDCSTYLIDNKYTSSEGLFAMGGSAGGMLMGAITNMAPDLYKGIVAYVPWMDVITDMTNPDLPLTTLEYDEWGDPNKKEYYDYMLSWSPYDNVKPADFPAILATGGVNDTQVPYFSPAKWVQKIRENNTGNELVLFKCNMDAGHAGASGRFASQKETSLVYAFILDQVNPKLVD